MRVVSLFAGIGGFDLAMERAGMKVVAQVEKDKNCLKLLGEKWPDVPQFDDVCTVGKHNLPECDVICGGFPCQDVSAAGKRAGLAGERSGLFYEMGRIIDERKPTWCIWENVPGLLNSTNGRDILAVVKEFHELGFDGGWRVIDAEYLGVAQRRRRVFGVFARRDIGARSPGEVLSVFEGVRGHPPPRRKARKQAPGTVEESPGAGGSKVISFSCKDHGADARDDVAPTLRSMNYVDSHISGGGHVAVAFKPSHYTRDKDGSPSEIFPPLSADADKGDQDPVIFQSRIARNGRGQPEDVCPALNGSDAGATSDMRPLVATKSCVRRLTPVECERLQGFPDDWTAGFSDSVRYRMLGNAVAVPCVEWIARRLANVEES